MQGAQSSNKAANEAAIKADFPDLDAAARACLSAMLPAFRIEAAKVWRSAIIFASPHSGHAYPAALFEQSVLSASQLRRNEDMFIDNLFGDVSALGAPLLCAHFPRCYVDANRAPNELPQDEDKAKPLKGGRETARARAGLGVVPTHISERLPIYAKPLSAQEAQARLHYLYHPYHAALRDLITQSHARFGQALLIDCHSMPGFSPMGSRRPDIVLGDRFGRSCQPETLAAVRSLFQSKGYSVAVNYPYAGGFVTDHYGQPEDGTEALQIEINRDLYLNPVTLSPKIGYRRLKRSLSEITQQLIELRRPLAIAAQ